MTHDEIMTTVRAALASARQGVERLRTSVIPFGHEEDVLITLQLAKDDLQEACFALSHAEDMIQTMVSQRRVKLRIVGDEG